MHTKYLIIGAGLTGLSSAYHLKDNYLLFEASDLPGGTASTLEYKGFKLDNGVHILYFRKQEILDWIQNELQINLLECDRKCSVWLNNSFIEFPVQYNLNRLPFVNRFNSVNSILAASFKKNVPITDSFEEYSLKTFGDYLTDVFVRPYNEKLFGVSLNDLNIDWFADYIPAYSKVKMLVSAAGFSKKNQGRNSKFYYPAKGGISEIASGICSKLRIAPNYKSSLIQVSLKNKTASFSDGSEIRYEYLINTIPLKNLLEKITDIPANILNYSSLLKKNSTTILHIFCSGQLKENDNHWIYTPNPSIPFYRITLPGNINMANCPDMHFATTLEIGGEININESVLNSCITALEKMKILHSNSSVIDYQWKVLDCGYVIYDRQRKVALNKILPFLLSNSISSVGRYGNWEYSNMEDALIQGKTTAEKMIQ